MITSVGLLKTPFSVCLCIFFILLVFMKNVKLSDNFVVCLMEYVSCFYG